MKYPVLLVTMNGDGPATGFASRVWWLADAMRKQGRTVHLLRFYPAFRAQGSWRQQADAQGVHVVEVPVPPVSRYRLARHLAMWFAGLFTLLYVRWSGARLVQAEAHEAAYALLRWWPIAVPVIVDFHGACVEEACSRRGLSPEDSSVQWLQHAERLAVSRAAACLVVSPRMSEYLREKHGFLVTTSFYEVPVSIDAEFIRPLSKDYARQALGIPSHTPLLVYCGGGQEYQCLEEMKQLLTGLMALLPKVHLLIISRDRAVFEEKFRGVWQRVTLRSADREEVPQWMMAGDAGLLLRHDRLLNRVACPTKFGEYLACGLPVITTPWAGHAGALVEKYDAGVVIADVGEASVQRVASLLATSPTTAERQRLQQIAIQHLNWQTAEANMRECHEQVFAAAKRVVMT